MQLDYEQVKSIFAKKGYKFYSGELNLNIFGVRMTTAKSNSFDDFLGVAYQHNGRSFVRLWSATTDPGAYWLQNPMNAKGTAILVPGQYPVYSIDIHNNSYKAICQRRGPVRVYRDGDKDNIVEMNPSSITSGSYGINIHRAAQQGETPLVNRHSAGCQVFQSVSDFNSLMSLAYDSEKLYGNKFTYTLFQESDFE